MAINIKFDGIDVKLPGGTPTWKPKTLEEIAENLAEEIRRDMEQLYTMMNNASVDVVTGAELDKLAELWGIVRKAGTVADAFGYGRTHSETDDELRVRIRTMAMGDDSGGYVSPTFGDIEIDGNDGNIKLIPEIPDNRGKFIRETKSKCECGAASLGYTQPGPGHASWCPIASK